MLFMTLYDQAASYLESRFFALTEILDPLQLVRRERPD